MAAADDTSDRIKAEGTLGLRAAQAGRMDVAGQHFNKALSLAEDIPDDRSRRDELSVLSILFDQSGVADLALMAAEESVELDRKLGLDDLLHQDMLNVGSAQLNLGNDAAAEQSFRDSLAIALARSEWANAASASTNLGNVFAQRNDFTQAISAYTQSLAYLSRESFDDTEINTRVMLLQVQEVVKDDAGRTIDNARALCERFWPQLAPMQRQAVEQFLPDAVDRYLAQHPQKDVSAWKTKTFPMIFR